MSDMQPVVIETVGDPLPEMVERKTADEHFMRLHLNYVRYAALERLVEAGVETLRARAKELQAISKPPHPLNERDLRAAVGAALDDLREAEALMKTMRRPPPVPTMTLKAKA